MKQQPRTPNHFHANYTVYPLGWRGQHYMGGTQTRGDIVVCPRCGRHGLRRPGYFATRHLSRPLWLSPMILHEYPVWIHEDLKDALCVLFEEQAPR